MALLDREYGPIQWRPRLDPISELVGTILSQHTSDLNADRAFGQLLEAFGSWEAVMEANEEAVADAINSAGLARLKAPRILGALREITARRGKLDLSFLRALSLEEAKEWLRQLPGVGPKTAAVVLCFALGMPAFPVDTHVHRVARRLGLIGPKVTAEQAHDLLEKRVAPQDVFACHVLLITHGRRVCKAQNPHCEACVLEPGCPSSRLRSGASSPERKRAAT
jgi:endonuclease-3